MITILLVEDDEIISEGIVEYLTVKGYQMYHAADGMQALELISRHSFDLVLLDIMLPFYDGYQLLREIRAKSIVPIIMLTALTDEQSQVQSFDMEADDFLSKPFSLLILEKRIEALLKRKSYLEISNSWSYGLAKIDFSSYLAEYDQVIVDVKPKEIQLLRFLVENRRQVLTREQILNHIWSDGEYPTNRVVDVYIKNLRKKLKLDCIATVKGVGYRLDD